jgi:hypothetical protein
MNQSSMLNVNLLRFPCYFIENSTRNGFLIQPLDQGVALLLFSTGDLATKYKKTEKRENCRTLIIRDASQLLDVLTNLPDTITHAIVDMEQGQENALCLRVKELATLVQERVAEGMRGLVSPDDVLNIMIPLEADEREATADARMFTESEEKQTPSRHYTFATPPDGRRLILMSLGREGLKPISGEIVVARIAQFLKLPANHLRVARVLQAALQLWQNTADLPF